MYADICFKMTHLECLRYKNVAQESCCNISIPHQQNSDRVLKIENGLVINECTNEKIILSCYHTVFHTMQPTTKVAAAAGTLLILAPTFNHVPSHLHDFEDVFSKESFDTLPEQCKWDHAIKLEQDIEGTSM
jgi:hypothetical protein